jgi:HEAT repeat protein
VSFLIEALGWKSKDVKFKAIEALGRSSDSRARTRLKGLFEDPDEDLRVEAFKAAPAAEDRNLLAELVAIAGGKKFSEKSETEQEAVLAALGRSRKDEAVDVLRAKLLKRRLLGRAKSAPARLFALHALEKMATPVAVEALTSARKIRPKKLRTEVLATLGRLSASGEKGKAL